MARENQTVLTRHYTTRGLLPLMTGGLAVLLVNFAVGADWQFEFDPNGNPLTQAPENLVAPRILGQPQTQVVGSGELASFFVVVADSRGVWYQWRFNGTNMSGATNDALLLLNVGATNEGNYSVVLSNPSGSVTSAPAALFLDSDGDGLPDSWELAHFGNLNQTASGDFDHDGVSNLTEFQDGTDPSNSNSALFRLNLGSDGGSVLVVPSQLTYTNGQAVTLTATPTAPNTFHGWTGSTNSPANPLVVLMHGNQTLQANFMSVTPPPDLVGWVRGESNTLDSIGGAIGIAVGGVTYAPGKVGTSFALNGTSGCVSLPDSPALRLSSLTLEAWVMFSAADGTGPVIAKSQIPGSYYSYYLILEGGNGGRRLYGVLVDSGGNVEAQNLPFEPAAGQWYHVAFTYDNGTRAKQLYINGVLGSVGATSAGFKIGNGGGPLLLGADLDNGSPNFALAGRIDEASIYSRALTYAEIRGIYNAGVSGKSVTSPYFTSDSPLPNAARWAPYSRQLTTVLGASPVSFSVSAGTLPEGLSLSASGLLSGTPTPAGSITFAITATDVNGRSTERAFNLTVVQPAAPAGMVGWWRAEGDATDAVTNRHGTAFGAVNYVAGKVGQAFGLNGVGRIEIPDSPAGNGVYELEPTNFTLEAWVKFNSPNGIIMAKPLTLGTFSSLDSFSLSMGFGGYLFGTVTDRSGGSHDIAYNLSPDTLQWYHLAFTYNSGSQVEALYVNGALVATAGSVGSVGYCVNCGNPASHDTHPVMLGAHLNGGNPSGFFDGTIDEPAIYNRALSQPEIAEIYNAGDVGKVYLSDLQQWKLTYLDDPNAPDSGDPDDDGLSNLQEYLAGTNPTNSASTFRINAITKENNDIRVAWTAGSGKNNTLQVSTSLGANFEDLFTITNMVGTVTNYLDIGAATNSSARFYRIRLSP